MSPPTSPPLLVYTAQGWTLVCGIKPAGKKHLKSAKSTARQDETAASTRRCDNVRVQLRVHVRVHVRVQLRVQVRVQLRVDVRVDVRVQVHVQLILPVKLT